MSRSLKIAMWLLFALVVAINLALPIVMYQTTGALSGPGADAIVACVLLFFLLLIITFLVRDALLGRKHAAPILASGMLGFSWLQLANAEPTIAGLVQTPSILWTSLVATVIDAVFGAVALLCLSTVVIPASSPGTARIRDALVCVMFVIALGVTGKFAAHAFQTVDKFRTLAQQSPKIYTPEIEKRFLAGDPTVVQDAETLIEIIRFGENRDARSKAAMELLDNHKQDPRAVLGFQLHAAEEFRRIEEALGKDR